MWILIAASWGFPLYFVGIMFMAGFGGGGFGWGFIFFMIFLTLLPNLILDLVIYFLFKKKSVNEEVINNKDINMKTAQQVNPQQASTIPTPPNQNMTPPEATTEMK